MKKSLILLLCFTLFFVLNTSKVEAATYSAHTGYTKYVDYADNIGIDVDMTVWEEFGVYYQEFTEPTSYYGRRDRDYGNLKVYIGVYHTIENEGYYDGSTYVERDNYMVFYLIKSVPKYFDGDQGYTNVIAVETDIDWSVDPGENNILLEYAPKVVNEGHTYTIGTSFGVSSSGAEASMSLQQDITIHDMEIGSYTSDPIFGAYYDYIGTSSYARTEQDHYGYFIVETEKHDFDFTLDFGVNYYDYDVWPWGYPEGCRIEESFTFYSNP